IQASTAQEANFAGGNESFEELPGFPIFIGTLSDDELSLADIDDDGFLEILVFGPNNLFFAINYNGVVDLELPRTIPGENRFTAPFLSPLALDVDGTPRFEVVLPMADGQVRAHDASGFQVQDFAYLGSGNQGTYPILSDLDGDGMLEMAIVEDIVTEIPEDRVLDRGDEDPDVVRSARLLVREVGTGTGLGPWPTYRGDPGRSGFAPMPGGGGSSVPEIASTKELFVMPNPARDGRAQIHYVPSSDVEKVAISIHDVAGQLVRTLDGSVYHGVDNLVVWDLTNNEGSQVAPGLFVARIDITGTEKSVTEFLTFAVLR
ncbi:MAG: hypothetical protein HKN21_03725, partial [Candidatus Eisenbacteria bacterium]|nr:hypothetical protein [Candidatus Eisenbacteria bacterium]